MENTATWRVNEAKALLANLIDRQYDEDTIQDSSAVASYSATEVLDEALKTAETIVELLQMVVHYRADMNRELEMTGEPYAE